ncbi:MAG: 16S rRNA (uracil(1498)-N(3))-methyltransferase [Dehalococcoidia bacterium]|nr:16S rRNA (uracil(1498)-N(3))-methyltransferase [Dehalococcoidia bacterium]
MSHVPRVYLPGRLAHGVITIDGEAGRHLATVLRIRPGDPLLLLPGDGHEWSATVASVTKAGVVAEVGELVRQEAPPAVVLETWCALVRPGRFEWALEKCVEAGTDVIRPIVTEFAQRGDTPSETKLARWQRIVIEAAEQSGRLFVPVLEAPAPLARIIETYRGALVFGAPTGKPPREVARLLPARGHIALVVGPEGGFSEAETATLARRGGIPTSFGPHILRTETAAVVGTALIRSLTPGMLSSP